MVKIPNQTIVSNELPPGVARIENLKNDEIQLYIDFFNRVVSDLEQYSIEEKDSAIKTRSPEYITNKLLDENWVFLVAKNKKGEIIASIEGRILKFKSGLVGNVLWVLTDKPNRNKTVGDRMSKEFEDIAVIRGCNKFLLLIKDNNKISIRMHTKRGYTENKTMEPKVEGSTWYIKEVQV